MRAAKGGRNLTRIARSMPTEALMDNCVQTRQLEQANFSKVWCAEWSALGAVPPEEPQEVLRKQFFADTAGPRTKQVSFPASRFQAQSIQCPPGLRESKQVWFRPISVGHGGRCFEDNG